VTPEKPIMPQWLATQIANGFSAFAGTSVTASVRMDEALLNEILTESLKDAAAGGGGGSPAPPLAPLLKLVRRAELHAEAGAVTLNVDLRV
jgi:hypothetical protein